MPWRPMATSSEPPEPSGDDVSIVPVSSAATALPKSAAEAAVAAAQNFAATLTAVVRAAMAPPKAAEPPKPAGSTNNEARNALICKASALAPAQSKAVEEGSRRAAAKAEADNAAGPQNSACSPSSEPSGGRGWGRSRSPDNSEAADDPLEVFHRSRPGDSTTERHGRSRSAPDRSRRAAQQSSRPAAGGKAGAGANRRAALVPLRLRQRTSPHQQPQQQQQRRRSTSRGRSGSRRRNKIQLSSRAQAAAAGSRGSREEPAHWRKGRRGCNRRSSSRSTSPLGLFHQRNDNRQKAAPRPARAPGKNAQVDGGVSLEKRIQTFVEQNQLDNKVARIMINMNPDDAEQVLDEGIDPSRCRNPTAVIVSRIRKIERAAGRPNAMRRYDRHSPDACSRSVYSRSCSACWSSSRGSLDSRDDSRSRSRPPPRREVRHRAGGRGRR